MLHVTGSAEHLDSVPLLNDERRLVGRHDFGGIDGR
jgi:hypothetical protein